MPPVTTSPTGGSQEMLPAPSEEYPYLFTDMPDSDFPQHWQQFRKVGEQSKLLAFDMGGQAAGESKSVWEGYVCLVQQDPMRPARRPPRTGQASKSQPAPATGRAYSNQVESRTLVPLQRLSRRYARRRPLSAASLAAAASWPDSGPSIRGSTGCCRQSVHGSIAAVPSASRSGTMEMLLCERPGSGSKMLLPHEMSPLRRATKNPDRPDSREWPARPSTRPCSQGSSQGPSRVQESGRSGSDQWSRPHSRSSQRSGKSDGTRRSRPIGKASHGLSAGQEHLSRSTPSLSEVTRWAYSSPNPAKSRDRAPPGPLPRSQIAVDQKQPQPQRSRTPAASSPSGAGKAQGPPPLREEAARANARHAVLQAQSREWTAWVLENVKEAKPSRTEDRVQSAGRRQAAVKSKESQACCGQDAAMAESAPDDAAALDKDSDLSGPPLERQVTPSSPSQTPSMASRRNDSLQSIPCTPTRPTPTFSASRLLGSPPTSSSKKSISKIQMAFEDAARRSSTASRRKSGEDHTEHFHHLIDIGDDNESLISVFKLLVDDGEVHKDSLSHALELMGAHPVSKWLDETLESVSKHATLDLNEFMAFVRAYRDRQCQEIGAAFTEIDADQSGAIDMAELAKLLERLGMSAMEVVIGEILEEVDLNGNGSIDLDEFERLWTLLEKREGFCKREYDRLLEAFCRFDANRSGSIDVEEVMNILGYLNYSVKPKEVLRIFEEVDVTGKGNLNESEYMMLMRRVREAEINAMTLCLPRVHLISKKQGLVRLLISLGYLPDEDALEECAAEAGIALEEDPQAALRAMRELSPPGRTQGRGRRSIRVSDLYNNAPPVVEIKDAWRFVELYRRREGMTTAELEDNAVAWDARPSRDVQPAWRPVPIMDEKEIELLDAQKALMWLGWEAPHEVQKQFLYEVDVDRTGGVSLGEFQKLVRIYHERECDHILKTCGQHDLPVGDCLHMVSKEQAEKVLEALGITDLQPDEVPPPQSSSPLQLQLAFDGKGGQARCDTFFTDVYGLSNFVRRRRRNIRKTYRDNEGFGPDDVKWMQRLYEEAGTLTMRKCLSGTNEHMLLFRLMQQLEEQIPEQMLQEMELAELVREMEETQRADAFTFDAFKRMMRSANNNRLRKQFEKEVAAVAATGYSGVDVKDFRKIFIVHNPSGTDRLSFEELKRILERISPLGTKLTGELKNIWKQCVKPLRQDMTADFPDFLCIMKECVDHDFANVRTATSNAHRRNSRALAISVEAITPLDKMASDGHM